MGKVYMLPILVLCCSILQQIPLYLAAAGIVTGVTLTGIYYVFTLFFICKLLNNKLSNNLYAWKK